MNDLDQIEHDLSVKLSKIGQLSDGQETQSLQHAIESIANSYHKKQVANAIRSIQELLDKKCHECDDIRDHIVGAYRSKLENRNELIVHGRCNFVSSLFERIHASLLQSKPSLSSVLEEYVRLRDNVVSKESAREIEDYLVERMNELASGQLFKTLEDFKNDMGESSLKTFLDNKNPSSVSDVFQFVFGSLIVQDDSQPYLMAEIFKLLKEEVINFCTVLLLT